MTQIEKHPLILVDGSFYFYRAYHTFPLLTNSAGEPTGAIYGVLNMLRSLLLKYQFSHVSLIFDAQGKTFRDELFAEYKSNRRAMPDDLRKQIKPLHKIVSAMGIPLIVLPGVEADDVIGTLALEAEMAGHPVLIISGDKDMAQLVTSKVTLINTSYNAILGPQEVRDKYGILPDLIIDLFALMGDASDNIPGVPGIGKKTAQALLQSLGGLDVLYGSLDSIAKLNFRGAKTIAAKLEKNKEIAYLSAKLATIKTSVELNFSYCDLNLSTPDLGVLKKLFKRFELKRYLADIETGSWLKNNREPRAKIVNIKKLVNEVTETPKSAKEEIYAQDFYVAIFNENTFIECLRQLKSAKIFAFGTETDSFDVFGANLIGLSFTIVPGKSIYLPVANSYFNAKAQLNRAYGLESLKSLLEDEKMLKIGQNMKFNIGILARYGINLRGITYDTMLESYVLNSSSGRHDMLNLANRYLGYKTIPFKKISSKDKNQLTLNTIDAADSIPYAAKVADVTLRLHLMMFPKLQKSTELLRLFNEIDMPLVAVLSHIEQTGVLIDPVILSIHSKELMRRMIELEIQAHKLAGESFNLASPNQIQTILYKKQKMPILKKTPGGIPSTNEEVLATLALRYALPKVILEYRSLSKLKTTYTDKLPLMINPITARVHTSYHQAVTVTGRLSCSDPNLQNIPMRNDEGRRIRQAFIAPEGYRIVSADYSQIELRIMAHLSQDAGLLKAFHEDQDVHSVTASEIFFIPIDQVTGEQRQRAKAINFGLIYGMSAFGLARQLGVSLNAAQRYMDRYFERYPGVLDYMKRIRKQVSEQGYVSTLDGRRVYLPDACSSNGMRRKSAERAAINAPMQGTAADITKRAMIAVDSWITRKEQRIVRMIMQVHDELVFEVHESIIELFRYRVRNLMEGSAELAVPLKVDVRVGANWGEAC